MKKFNNKSGFTLIEIIVVLIIVGILAAIALPNLFSNVTKSKAGEAIASMSPFKAAIEGCIINHVGSELTACGGNVGLPLNTTNFDYSFGAGPLVNGTGGGNYTIVAANTTNAANTVTLTKSTATSTFSCSGAGGYAGVC